MADLEYYREYASDIECHNTDHPLHKRSVSLPPEIVLAMLDIIETAPKGCCCSHGILGVTEHSKQCKKRQAAWERLEKL